MACCNEGGTPASQVHCYQRAAAKLMMCLKGSRDRYVAANQNGKASINKMRMGRDHLVVLWRLWTVSLLRTVNLLLYPTLCTLRSCIPRECRGLLCCSSLGSAIRVNPCSFVGFDTNFSKFCLLCTTRSLEVVMAVVVPMCCWSKIQERGEAPRSRIACWEVAVQS